MKKLPVLALWLLGSVSPLWLTGCFSTVTRVRKIQAAEPGTYKTSTVEQLEQDVSNRDAAIRTLSASVLITASVGGGTTGKVTTYTSFRGYIFVRKPRDLRVLLQLPVLGSKALDMVSNGTNFTLLIPPRNKAVIGTDKVTTRSANGLENLRPAVFFDSLLVPGVAPDEYVTVTTSNRIVEAETGHKAMYEPDYDVTILKVKNGHTLAPERVVHISRMTMLPIQQDVYNDAGEIETQATYENYQPVGELQFPRLITIRRPLDEYALKIEVTKLTLNETLDDDQFPELKIPSTYAVQKMQ